jgi:hypothetical protein
MRIDEFSSFSEIDGVLTSIEKFRFLLFGFDYIGYSEWREELSFDSDITKILSFNSTITKTLSFDSILGD